MPAWTAQLERNLSGIRRRIDEAARRAGREPETVRLVAVTKYVDSEVAAELVRLGCRELGESRPQELWRKAEALASQADAIGSVRWHLIGHLQRNKIRRTLPLVSMIESVDSTRLLDALNAAAAAERTAPVEVLLEVNVSGDVEKHGFRPEALPEVVERLGALEALRVRGLMTMAAREGGVSVARQDFRRLRELRDRVRPICPPPHALDELSMGMTRDFEVAIEEGATIVRIGSALFEGIGR